MRASRLHPAKPFYRIIIPINNDDLKGKDIKYIINSFEEIDENIETAIKNKSQTRIKINIHNSDNDIELDADYLWEEIYTRLGEWITKRKTWDESHQLLFQYCDEYKKTPNQLVDYNDYRIGIWFGHQKEELKITRKNNDIYRKLSKHPIVRHALDDYFEYLDKPKLKKLNWNEWCQLLFEYCNNKDGSPQYNTIYKKYNIGSWLNNQKIKIKEKDDKELYTKLSKNSFVKELLDKYLEKHVSKKRLTWEESKHIMFDYCNEYEKIPTGRKTIHKGYNLVTWYQHQKTRIKEGDNNIYDLLSKNQYIKKDLDVYLKSITNKQDKLEWDDWCRLLFEYCNENKKAPTAKNNTEYKGYKIGIWLGATQWRKIRDENDKLYKDLSKNRYVREWLEKSMINKRIREDKEQQRKLSCDEWCQLLFDYCEEYEKIPRGKDTLYKGRKLVGWFQHKKKQISDGNENLYQKLSKNSYVKKELDRYLSEKVTRDNKLPALKFGEGKQLLFEYCNEKKRIPYSKGYL